MLTRVTAIALEASKRHDPIDVVSRDWERLFQSKKINGYVSVTVQERKWRKSGKAHTVVYPWRPAQPITLNINLGTM